MRGLARVLLSVLLGLTGAGLVFLALAVLLADSLAPGPAASDRVRPAVAARSRPARSHPARMRLHLRPAARPLPARPEVARRLAGATEQPDGQIVETARPAIERRPTRSRYLGRYDVTVAREQKARERRPANKEPGRVALIERSRLQSPESTSPLPTSIPAPAATAPPSAEGSGPTPQAPGQRRPEAGKAPGSTEPPRPSVVRGAHAGLLLPATSAGNVLHNLQALAGSPGGSDDWLPDVEEEGDLTLLNTRKYRYWDFFQRVKERVRSEWQPAEVWRSRDPTGKRYGIRDRLTVLRVTLDPEGLLREVQIARQSGLGFLDDEARRAFAAAGPYPNPPRGLLNDRGEVQFNFGFMFEISTSRFRFYRVEE
jgi:TonB family protein